jgi:hypothetical protein
MKQIISILLVLLSLEITAFSQTDQTSSLNPKPDKAQPLSFRSENEEKYSPVLYQQEQERLLAILRDKCYQNAAEPGSLFELQEEQQAMTGTAAFPVNNADEYYEAPIKKKTKMRKHGFLKVLGKVVLFTGSAFVYAIGSMSLPM